MKPCYFAYNSLEGVEEAAAPGVIIVTGRGNRPDIGFQHARSKGAAVQAYWNPFNVPDVTKDPQELEQWMGGQQNVPRWRFNGTGPIRSNWKNTQLADITPGSAWRKYFTTVSSKLIASKWFDGFFCDTLGAKPWAAGYDEWPIAEQKLWTECAVDLARELHETRMAINPKFDLVHNNVWNLPPGHPAAAIAKTGDQYCNGVCLENTPPDRATGRPQLFHTNYASRVFGVPDRRLLLVVTSNPVYAVQWAMVPGLTHISLVDASKQQNYLKLVPALDAQIAALVAAAADAGDNGAELARLRTGIGQLMAQAADLEEKLRASYEAADIANAWIDAARLRIEDAIKALQR